MVCICHLTYLWTILLKISCGYILIISNHISEKICETLTLFKWSTNRNILHQRYLDWICINGIRSAMVLSFFSRRGHTVFQQALLPKQEFIFLVRMSPIQRTLYIEFMNSLQVQNLGTWANTNPLKAFAVCCKVEQLPGNHVNAMMKFFYDFSLWIITTIDGN